MRKQLVLRMLGELDAPQAMLHGRRRSHTETQPDPGGPPGEPEPMSVLHYRTSMGTALSDDPSSVELEERPLLVEREGTVILPRQDGIVVGSAHHGQVHPPNRLLSF